MATQKPFWNRQGWVWLLTVCMAASGGCSALSFMNPVEEPCTSYSFAEDFPQCCKDHVYIFFIHGWDPFDAANLWGVRDYCRHLGYHHTYLAQCYHKHRIASEIKDIRERDPESRFVLVGYSVGAIVARDTTNIVGQWYDIDVELVMYLGGWMLNDQPLDRPPNAGKVVHVLALGYDEWGTPLADAENVKLNDDWHFGSPTHPETLEILIENLAEITARVPIVESLHEPITDEKRPTPRPERLSKPQSMDEWDFLKPSTRLGSSNPDLEPPPPRRPRLSINRK